MLFRPTPTPAFSVAALFVSFVALATTLFAAPTPAPKPTQKPGMARVYGMPPAMFRDYMNACYQARINPKRITQTIGGAPASAGYHFRDGTLPENGIQYDYGAAVDLRSRDLNDVERRRFLFALVENGFAGWYRTPRQFPGNEHFHLVYARYHMKHALRDQFHDFMNDRTGLVGHKKETFFRADAKQKQRLRVMFLRTNPARN